MIQLSLSAESKITISRPIAQESWRLEGATSINGLSYPPQRGEAAGKGKRKERCFWRLEVGAPQSSSLYIAIGAYYRRRVV
ncbi:hypothetical protein, partial [Tianweitania sp.]|uniref:hypothetical protein n=1 Tax=Tianweitania sp. TaxID=2021634 RepID=UPI002899C422